MNEQAQALVRQLRQAIQRSCEGYPLQITFEPSQLVLLGEILDDAEARENESEIWRKVEALAQKVLAEPRGAPVLAGHTFISQEPEAMDRQVCVRCGISWGARSVQSCSPVVSTSQGSKQP